MQVISDEKRYRVNMAACQGLSVVREAQAQGVCASELVPGHLPNEEVEARHGHRAGGKDRSREKHKQSLARPRQAPAAAKWDWVGTKGRVRAQGPCWRPSCPSPDSCNAGAECPVHLRLQEVHGHNTSRTCEPCSLRGRSTPLAGTQTSTRFRNASGEMFRRTTPCRYKPGPCAESQAHLPPARLPLQGHGPVPPHILWGEEEAAPGPPIRLPLEERIAEAFDGLNMDQEG
ncbi:unnamed protein product [Cladocopium goreaui]|uniref:Uncharacterized protein n=1 Tax=Cladocopium goreaui TaxID=2562237 RepID=A0A9P1FN81_9DINO|nr:unnamed protein product [Cladocopium goreaui]